MTAFDDRDFDHDHLVFFTFLFAYGLQFQQGHELALMVGYS